LTTINNLLLVDYSIMSLQEYKEKDMALTVVPHEFNVVGVAS